MLFEHEDDNPIRVLTEEESWALLGRSRYGRLATCAAGVIDVVPINVKVAGRRLLVRTGPGTKLAEIAVGGEVVFEADGVSSEEAWSVVVKGRGHILERASEIEDAERAGLEAWTPAFKNVYVEISPEHIEGRHFVLGPETARI